MKLIKVLSFICMLCFAMALVGFSGAWGEEETYLTIEDLHDLTIPSHFTGPHSIIFYARVPCDSPKDESLFDYCQKKVGTLYLTDPISFEGQVDKSAEVFFQYVIKNIIKCKEVK